MTTLDEYLRKIDEKLENPRLLKEYAISLNFDSEVASRIYELVKLEGRYACLLNLFLETGKKVFLNEAERQHKKLLKQIPEDLKIRLLKEENIVKGRYFKYYRKLRKKVVRNHYVKGKDIWRWMKIKSSDARCYGIIASYYLGFEKILRDLLHARQFIADVLDDIKDYEEDLASSWPNLLILYFLSLDIDIPNKKENAITIAKKLGVARDILEKINHEIREMEKLLARERKEELKESNIFKDIIKKKMEIEKLLSNY